MISYHLSNFVEAAREAVAEHAQKRIAWELENKTSSAGLNVVPESSSLFMLRGSLDAFDRWVSQLVPEADIDLKIRCKPSDLEIRGNCCHSGDDRLDEEICEGIEKALMSNQWAWCDVEIVASWCGLSGSAYLSGFSYGNEREFIDGGYWEQLRAEAIEELRKRAVKVWEGMTGRK